MNEFEIKDYLCHSQSLLNHIFWFKQDFGIQPSKEHTGTSINFTDIKERKDDFLKELVNTVTSWVYNKEKIQSIFNERLAKTENDYGNAATFLATTAFSKFRPGQPQGQFGELLLFNFLQYFFQSVPLLRKQKITTSVGHERFGADAIHYKAEDNRNIFVLGESKCYKSDYKFNAAFKCSLESIIDTFNSLDKELDLYTYDDFLEPKVEDIAKAYKSGQLNNVHFELVCLVAYNETKKISGEKEAELKDSIQQIIQERCDSIDDKLFHSIENRIVSRLNYIIFPIWELDNLLEVFQKQVGSK